MMDRKHIMNAAGAADASMIIRVMIPYMIRLRLSSRLRGMTGAHGRQKRKPAIMKRDSNPGPARGVQRLNMRRSPSSRQKSFLLNLPMAA